MRDIKRVLSVMLMVMVLMVTATACDKNKDNKEKETFAISAGETKLSISVDGKVVYQAVEEFDFDKYSKEDFEKDLKAELEEYNGDDEFVTLDEVKEGTNLLMMKITFVDTDAYAGYAKEYTTNGADVILFNGTVEEGKADGIEFADNYKKADKDSEVKFSEIEKEDIRVLVTNEALKIEVPGDILYVSEGTKISDGVAVTTEETNYIFYKEKEEK